MEIVLVVELLLSFTGSEKINVNSYYRGSALSWACRQHCVDVVKLLLSLTGDDQVHLNDDNEKALRELASEVLDLNVDMFEIRV